MGDKTIVFSQTFETDEKVAAERFQQPQGAARPRNALKKINSLTGNVSPIGLPQALLAFFTDIVLDSQCGEDVKREEAMPKKRRRSARLSSPALSGTPDLPGRQDYNLTRFDGFKWNLPPAEGLVGKPRPEQVVKEWAGHISADPARKTRLGATRSPE